MDKLNIKTVKLSLENDCHLFALSYGYIIAISKSIGNRSLYLYKMKNDNYILIKQYKLIYAFYIMPPIIKELKNKTILIAVKDYVLFLKIKNDEIYSSCCLDRFMDNEFLGYIVDVIEIENENIIIENITGNIYVAIKNKIILNEELNQINDEDGKLFLNFDSKEYVYKYKIPNNCIGRDIHPIIYSKKNIVFFDKYKIDFTSDKFEKIKTNEINIINVWVQKLGNTLNNKFEFKDFVFGLNEKKLIIINKEYEEIIAIIELAKDIRELIHIENNIYLFSLDEKVNKIYLVDFSNLDYKIIESKQYNFKYIVKNENENKIFLIDIQEN